jgi:hypothetical protein
LAGALDTLNGILPHLRRLAEARAVLTHAETRTRDAEALLPAPATAILLVDETGLIAFANAAAEGSLALDDGLGSRCGVLRASGPQAARLEAAIRRTAGVQASGDALLVDRLSGAGSYRLLIALHRGPRASIIMIEDLSSADPGLGSRLRLLFDLTAVKADLMVRLVGGDTLSEASDARRVLVSTSRSQLNAVLSKTGLRRQGELLAMIARLPRITEPSWISPK